MSWVPLPKIKEYEYKKSTEDRQSLIDHWTLFSIYFKTLSDVEKQKWFRDFDDKS